jgi:hypothetical protein
MYNFVRVASVWLVISCVIAFSVPTFVHRHEFTQAAADFAKNPSTENARNLNIEREKLRRVLIRTQFAAWAALFAGGLAVYGGPSPPFMAPSGENGRSYDLNRPKGPEHLMI